MKYHTSMFITEAIVIIPASKINFWIRYTQIFVTARYIVCVCLCVLYVCIVCVCV